MGGREVQLCRARPSALWDTGSLERLLPGSQLGSGRLGGRHGRTPPASPRLSLAAAPFPPARDKKSRRQERGMKMADAKQKRNEQLKRWIGSETDLEPPVVKRQKTKVKFDDGAVFLAACSSGDTDEVLKLLHRGADINYANVDGLTALHQVCGRPPLALRPPTPTTPPPGPRRAPARASPVAGPEAPGWWWREPPCCG